MIFIEIGHGVIAGAYFTLAAVFGLWLVPFLFDKLPKYLPIASPRRFELEGVRYGFVAFFVGCGVHHFDFMTHAITNEPIAYLAFHHIAAEVLQVVGALVVVASLAPYILAQDINGNGYPQEPLP